MHGACDPIEGHVPGDACFASPPVLEDADRRDVLGLVVLLVPFQTNHDVGKLPDGSAAAKLREAGVRALFVSLAVRAFQVADEHDRDARVLGEASELRHDLVDGLPLVAVIEAGDNDRQVIEDDEVDADARAKVPDLVQQVVAVEGSEVVVEEDLLGDHVRPRFVEARPLFRLLHQVQALPKVERHEAEGRPIDRLFEGDVAALEPLTIETIGNKPCELCFPDSAARANGDDLATADPTSHRLEPCVRVGPERESLAPRDEHLLDLIAAENAVRSVDLRVPHRRDDLGATPGLEQFVRVLHRQVRDGALAGREDLGALERRLLARIVHVEHEDDALETFEPLERLLQGLRGTCGAVWDGDDGPSALVHLRHGQGVDFTLGDDDHLAPARPKVLPEQDDFLRGSDPCEGLVGEAGLLRHDVAGGVGVAGQLHGLAADHGLEVAVLLASLLTDPTGRQGPSGALDEGHRLGLHDDRLKVVGRGVDVVLAAEAEGMAVVVEGCVVRRPTLFARYVPHEFRFTHVWSVQ